MRYFVGRLLGRSAGKHEGSLVLEVLQMHMWRFLSGDCEGCQFFSWNLTALPSLCQNKNFNYTAKKCLFCEGDVLHVVEGQTVLTASVIKHQ